MEINCNNIIKLGYVMRWLWKGVSLPRALEYSALSEIELKGRVLDLGSAGPGAQYFDIMKSHKNVDVTCTNLEASDGVIALNVEEKFPFESDYFDYVCAFNLFEHVAKIESAPQEIGRVLKPNGYYYHITPFLFQVHGSPCDYYRYTSEAIKKVWSNQCLNLIEIYPLGGANLAALHLVTRVLVPRKVRGKLLAIILPFAWWLDRIVDFVSTRKDGKCRSLDFPLCYMAVFRKF